MSLVQLSKNNAFTMGYSKPESAYANGVLVHRRMDSQEQRAKAKSARQTQATYEANRVKRKADTLSAAERTKQLTAFIKPHGTGFDPKDQRQL